MTASIDQNQGNNMMTGAAIGRFGDINELKLQTLPVPKPGPDEVLIKVDTADVGVWAPLEINGFFAEMMGLEPDFPYIPGSDGSGIVAAVGEEVRRFQEGDHVYAYGSTNPETNFYAEYATMPADSVMPVPEGLSLEEAGAMPSDAITALFGLDQILKLQADEKLLVFGASGGLGHLAVQLAKRMGADIFAVASGTDGVDFVQELGADRTVNGYEDGIAEAAQTFAPQGFDAALLAAGGEAAQQALTTMHKGGRVAYPNGVDPVPTVSSDVEIQAYNGRATPALFNKLNNLIEAGSFSVHIAQNFPLKGAIEAHRALNGHYLGKLALKISE
jgi:NADPH:quinone reductase-like Zn-dependent oxidoreductase